MSTSQQVNPLLQDAVLEGLRLETSLGGKMTHERLMELSYILAEQIGANVNVQTVCSALSERTRLLSEMTPENL